MYWSTFLISAAAAGSVAQAALAPRGHFARNQNRAHADLRRAMQGRGSSPSLVMNAETPEEFYSWFDFSTIDDPSGGSVDYVDRQTAESENMLWTGQNGGLGFGPNTQDTSGPYRHSIRLQSNQTWGYGIYAWDISHMPVDCATWPALWTTTQSSWPAGEMDVLEGVNGNGLNQGALHTDVECKQNDAGWQTGTTHHAECKGGAGCGVAFSNKNSFGPNLNNAGGAVFALLFAQTGVSMWMFDRNSVPTGLKRGDKGIPNVGDWGPPEANWSFGGDSCPVSSVKLDQTITMNIDFCGWAASAPGSCNFGNQGCNAYVLNNPDKFKNSYFDINRFSLWAWE